MKGIGFSPSSSFTLSEIRTSSSCSKMTAGARAITQVPNVRIEKGDKHEDRERGKIVGHLLFKDHSLWLCFNGQKHRYKGTWRMSSLIWMDFLLIRNKRNEYWKANCLLCCRVLILFSSSRAPVKLLAHLFNCLPDISTWIASRHLKLNLLPNQKYYCLFPHHQACSYSNLPRFHQCTAVPCRGGEIFPHPS